VCRSTPWGRRFNEIPLFDVADDSDHLTKHRLREGQSGAVADRIVGSPIQLRGILADEQHLAIVLDDVAPTQQRNPHRPKVTGINLPNLHRHRIALRRIPLES
jgi:hypothetical protein